jgi:hypothetical protein
MAGKYIEVGVSFADHDVDPPQSKGMGAIRWNADDLTAGAEVMTPIDPKVIALLEAFIADYHAEIDALRQSLERR